MLLFIFQSIGTQELILIGLVALIFLGPRKLPEYARKIGKMMADLRNTAGEFRSTWEREVDLESEVKAFDLDAIEAEAKEKKSEPRIAPPREANAIEAPAIREVDASSFQRETQPEEAAAEPAPDAVDVDDANELDKRNWL
ncbi:MAG: twin-arginine translocase TatA/TatE family subunit [Acidobacteria bacterium]|nr:twin-arginine translocase TatA/TatE family subunit [Acidobacteriota bacterium]